jgi:hypothetical protein
MHIATIPIFGAGRRENGEARSENQTEKRKRRTSETNIENRHKGTFYGTPLDPLFLPCCHFSQSLWRWFVHTFNFF